MIRIVVAEEVAFLVMDQFGVDRREAFALEEHLDVLVIPCPCGTFLRQQLVYEDRGVGLAEGKRLITVKSEEHVGVMHLALLECAIRLVGNGQRDARDGVTFVQFDRFEQFIPAGDRNTVGVIDQAAGGQLCPQCLQLRLEITLCIVELTCMEVLVHYRRPRSFAFLRGELDL